MIYQKIDSNNNNTIELYSIGNSLTQTVKFSEFIDIVTKQLGQKQIQGRQIVGGSSLKKIWNNPNQGSVTQPYGYFSQALTKYSWDFLSLEPFNESIETEVEYMTKFIDLAAKKNHDIQLLIFEIWPFKDLKKTSYSDAWNRVYTGYSSNAINLTRTRDFMETLTEKLKTVRPNILSPMLIPIGEVLYEIEQQIKAGKLPGFKTIYDLYIDAQHFNLKGYYIATMTLIATIYKVNPSTLDGSLITNLNPQVKQVFDQAIQKVVTQYPMNGSDLQVVEGNNSYATFTLRLGMPKNHTVTVKYITENGTAIAGQDYVGVNSPVTVTFAPNQTFKKIIIPLKDDNLQDGNETFFLKLFDPIGATLRKNKIIANIDDQTLSVTSSITLPPFTENAVLTGKGNFFAMGNAGNNQITGNSGNNFLNGGAGNDTLIGGAGNDTYQVDSDKDTIIDNYNGGIDTVKSTFSFSLVTLPNVENVTLIGNQNVSATGNGQNNLLTGNNGNNLLNGGAGNDTLIGNIGNDIYQINSVKDKIIENYNGGIDTVDSSVSFTLVSLPNVENIRLSGNAHVSATGNYKNNLLTGNNGNNILTGGAGKDTLTGGAGKDRFFFQSSNENIDTITDFNVALDLINISKINFGGTLVLGTLNANQFVVGSKATDSNTRFIYNKNSGGLYYDKDGTAISPQVQFASLQANLGLSNSDIVVV